MLKQQELHTSLGDVYPQILATLVKIRKNILSLLSYRPQEPQTKFAPSASRTCIPCLTHAFNPNDSGLEFGKRIYDEITYLTNNLTYREHHYVNVID